MRLLEVRDDLEVRIDSIDLNLDLACGAVQSCAFSVTVKIAASNIHAY